MDKLDCGITDLLRSIPKYEVGCKCDASLALYADKDSETPECSHSFSSKSRLNLLKLIALMGVTVAGVSMLCALCSFLCGSCKNK
ncbi:MAG: hypothetical protein E7670_05705 [Ruminococcaceae bacterium]|nr:hypothetical protein [Oscillospiraceae bacterium]